MTTNSPFASVSDISARMDHTVLKPEATQTTIEAACEEAREFLFASVCVNPCWVPLVHSQLAGSNSKTCTVIGFPLGANTTKVKVEEARLAISEGAAEIDMVINIGALLSGNSKLVADEIRELVTVAHASGAILKVILETCLLTKEQKISVCKLAKAAGANFVKTSTGFSTGGATEEDVALMRATVGEFVGVKASGGVRTLDAFNRMFAAGADRIGTSSGVQIIAEFRSGSPGAGPAAGSY